MPLAYNTKKRSCQAIHYERIIEAMILDGLLLPKLIIRQESEVRSFGAFQTVLQQYKNLYLTHRKPVLRSNKRLMSVTDGSSNAVDADKQSPSGDEKSK